MSNENELKEAAVILRKFQDWRRGYDVRTMVDAGIDNKELGRAIDTILAHFGLPEPLTFCRDCKWNGDVKCNRKECRFER